MDAETLTRLERDAEAGDPAAQLGMMRACLAGDGVARDLDRASRWLDRAADGGHVEAMRIRGSSDLRSDEVAVVRAGRQELERAAATDPAAALTLAVAYLTGEHLPDSADLGFLWLQRARVLGAGPTADGWLGMFFMRQGQLHEALRFFDQAIAAGDPTCVDRAAQVRQEMRAHDASDDERAYCRACLRRAGVTPDARDGFAAYLDELEALSAQGELAASAVLTRLFDLGWGVPIDPPRATTYLARSAARLPHAAVDLACRYLFGGVPGKGYPEAADLLAAVDGIDDEHRLDQLARTWLDRNGPFEDETRAFFDHLREVAGSGHLLSRADLERLGGP